VLNKNPETPERYVSSEDRWKSAENVLIKVLKKKNIAYTEMRGEAAFYDQKLTRASQRLVIRLGRQKQ
jgi:threonyl-tRNA synthetase